jgi:hypothetical protein
LNSKIPQGSQACKNKLITPLLKKAPNFTPGAAMKKKWGDHVVERESSPDPDRVEYKMIHGQRVAVKVYAPIYQLLSKNEVAQKIEKDVPDFPTMSAALEEVNSDSFD